MPSTSRPPFSPEYSLPVVSHEIVDRIEHDGQSVTDMLRHLQLQENNPELANFIRRLATRFFPDMKDREAASLMTLEALQAVESQIVSNSLMVQFGEETVPHPSESNGLLPPAA